MRSKTRERAKRIIVSSLLRSDLTMSEIREIGKAFVNQFDFSQDLGSVIKDVVMTLGTSTSLRYTKHHKPDYERNNEPFERAILLINKKRLPKRQVVPILNALSPDMEDYLRKAKLTMREMVTAFFKTASKSQIAEFMDWLEKGLSYSDDYLKGIMRRS